MTSLSRVLIGSACLRARDAAEDTVGGEKEGGVSVQSAPRATTSSPAGVKGRRINMSSTVTLIQSSRSEAWAFVPSV